MPEQNVPTPGAGSHDPVERLAALTQRSSSIFGRHEAAPPDVPPPPSVDRSAATRLATDAPSAKPDAPLTPPRAPLIIGRLTKLGAEELWPTAAAMSTSLAADIAGLAEAIGLEVASVAASGPGRVAGRSADGTPVTVACEPGPSSDSTLAAVLATAASQEGGMVVWVAGTTDTSHGVTVSWLNRSAAGRFFYVRAHGVRIGESAAAPLFDVVVRPPRASAATDEPTAEPEMDAATLARRVSDHGVG